MKFLSLTLIIFIMTQFGKAKQSYFLKKQVAKEFDNLYNVQIGNLSKITEIKKNFIYFQKNYLSKIILNPSHLSSKIDILDKNQIDNSLVYKNRKSNITEFYRPVQMEIITPSNHLIEKDELNLEIQIFNENTKDENKTLCFSLFFVISNNSILTENILNNLINSFEKPSNIELNISILSKIITQGSIISYKLPGFTKNDYKWVVFLEYLPISKFNFDRLSKILFERRYLNLFKNKAVELNYTDSFIYKRKSDLIQLEREYFSYNLKHSIKNKLKTVKNISDVIEEEDFNDFDFMNLIEKISKRQEEGEFGGLDDNQGKTEGKKIKGKEENLDESDDFSPEDFKNNSKSSSKKNKTKKHKKNKTKKSKGKNKTNNYNSSLNNKNQNNLSHNNTNIPPAPPLPPNMNIPQPSTLYNINIPTPKKNIILKSNCTENTNISSNKSNGILIDKNEDVINLPHVFKHENVYIHKGFVRVNTTLIIGKRC